MKPNISIAIAEDHVLFRQGMVSLLNEEEDFNIVFVAGNGVELLDQLKEQVPNIILLDISMPVMEGKEALSRIRELYPEAKVIMLSMYYESSYIAEYLAKGARAFLPKNCDIEKVIEAVRTVHNKGFYFDDEISGLLMDKLLHVEKQHDENVKLRLTERETQVLNLICLEKSNKEIAEMLHISIRTVEGHRQCIMTKTDTKNVLSLVMFALRNKIISLPS
jgi:DNA-binding NarL/FixJ family response regulator